MKDMAKISAVALILPQLKDIANFQNNTSLDFNYVKPCLDLIQL